MHVLQGVLGFSCAEQLFFTVKATVPPGETVSLEVARSVGIYIPRVGVTENSSQLVFLTNAAAGALFGIPSPYAATVDSNRFSFTPPRAGTVIAIDISLTTDMNMSTGEILYFKFPGFVFHPQGTSSQVFHLGLASANISWSQASETLSVVLRQPLPYCFSLTIQIPTSSNLSMPAGGVRREGSGIAVKVDAKHTYTHTNTHRVGAGMVWGGGFFASFWDRIWAE